MNKKNRLLLALVLTMIPNVLIVASCITGLFKAGKKAAAIIDDAARILTLPFALASGAMMMYDSLDDDDLQKHRVAVLWIALNNVLCFCTQHATKKLVGECREKTD